MLALLNAYLDASSGGQPPRIISVAGYVALVGIWERVESEWRKGLQYWRIPYFHMTDLHQEMGIEKAELCKLYFERIIKSDYLWPFGAALPIADWHNPDWRSLPTPRLASPYEQCLYFAIDALGRLLNRRFPGEEAALISCMDGPERHIESAFRVAHREYPQIVSATIGSSKRIIPLQCADLGAGRLRESWRTILTGGAENVPWGRMPRNDWVSGGLSFWSLNIDEVGSRYDRILEEERKRLEEAGWIVERR